MRFRVYKRASKKRRTTWTYLIEIGKDADGKRIRDTKSGFRTRHEAEVAGEVKMAELKAKPPEDKTTTLREVVEAFLIRHGERRCAPKTLERYRQEVVRISDAVLDLPVSQLSPIVLEEEYQRLKDGGGKRRKTLGAKTIRNVHGVIHAALEKGVKWGMTDKNPADNCDLPPAEPRKARSLTVEELRNLLDFTVTHWMYPIIRFAADTGCRRGEILALQWTDIDFKTGRAMISKSLEQTKDGLRIKSPKNGRTRECPLPAGLLDILKTHRQEQDSARRAFGKDYRSDLDLVFAGPDGDFLKPDSATATFCRLSKQAGLQRVGLHTLRHTHGSLLMVAGHALATVSKRLGHVDPSITARIYAHTLTSEERRAADDWQSLMDRFDGSSKVV